MNGHELNIALKNATRYFDIISFFYRVSREDKNDRKKEEELDKESDMP